jgi:hypothetical protein
MLREFAFAAAGALAIGGASAVAGSPYGSRPLMAMTAASDTVAASATASAVRIPNADQWGAMARLGGTAWLDPANGTVWEFSWVEPGEIMTWKAHRRDGEFTYRATVNAKGFVAVEVQSQVAILTPQSKDVFLLGAPDLGWRYYMRVTPRRLTTGADLFNNGTWVPNNKEAREFEPLPASGVASALAELAPKQEAYRTEAAAKEAAQRAEAAAKEAELKTPWGRVSAMAGRRFTGSDDDGQWVIRFSWAKWWKKWDAVGVFLQKYGEARDRGWQEYIYNDLSEGKVRFQADDSSTDKFFFQPDGSFGYIHARFRLLADGNLEVAYGKWHSDGSFTLKSGPFVWRSFSDQENAQRIAQIQQNKNQSGDGGSGFGSILAGAAMGAILGGGGQNSVDLAVAGAQAAAQGGNTLDVLHSMGNAAGANSNNTASLLTGMSGGAGAVAAKPPVPMPGCDAVGVNEGNYRTAALSGGNDTQLKTMCGEALEYYAMYKRALAQGYSEADANRTYDAHAQSAAVANDFYANNRAN